MPIHGTLSVPNGDTLGALRAFLGTLLENKVVDALLVPVPTPDRRNLVPTLVRDPAQLANADPIAPVMPIQTARVLSQLTFTGTKERLAVVLKACEWRAVVELTKLKQIDLEKVLTIGIDCYGTFKVLDYGAMAAPEPNLTARLLETAEPTTGFAWPGRALRTACRVCDHFVPTGVDIRLGLLGMDPRQEILVELADGRAELAPLLGIVAQEAPAGRAEAIAALQQARKARRDEAFAAIREQIKTREGMMNIFSPCLRCHNCTVVCPICYCRECIFRTPTFDHDSQQYMKWADRRGAVRMPTDTILFQITRLNHMSASCVACGLCEEGCPSDLPLTLIFSAVGEQVQKVFEYEAGRSLEDELPLTVFREDELHVVEK